MSVFAALPPVVAAATSWAAYNDSQSGLTVAYPKGWTIKPSTDAAVLFKIEGTTADSYFGALELHKSEPGTTAKQLAAVVEASLFSPLPGYKKITTGDTKFGRSARFSGSWDEIAFNLGDMRLRQRWYFFTHNGRTYMLAFTSPEQGFAKTAPLFDQILSSLDVDPNARAARDKRSAATTSAQPARQAAESWELTALDPTQHSPIGIAFPSGWKVERDQHGDEVGWKVSGTNRAGHDAEMHLWTMPRGELQLDQLTEMTIEQHMKPLPQYRVVSRGRSTVNGAEAVTQSSSFLADGVPGKMNTVFFTDRDRFYCVAMMSATWSPEQMRDLFDRVVGSVKVSH